MEVSARSLWILFGKRVGNSRSMAGGRKTTYTRKRKKVRSHLQPPLELQIDLRLTKFSNIFGSCCKFSMRNKKKCKTMRSHSCKSIPSNEI
jgi:hypothetical protein